MIQLTDETASTIKGRGALSNPKNRFEATAAAPFHDGWDITEEIASRPQTAILRESVKTIISNNTSPDIGFDQSINPYRGCEHGCIYCYARPTHAYWDMSPGLDFETRIVIKENAAEMLREKLSKPGYIVKPICIGANTDPYQPIEAKLKLTRSIIKMLAEFRHPFSIITKSHLITRDLDLLAPMAENRLCNIAVSVTTLDNHLKRILEPRTPSGQKRLNTIKVLGDAGINITIMAAPMIPFINDQELESLLKEGKAAGASDARYILIRLPLEVSDLFQDWLKVHFPDRAAKVMNVIRQCRGGRNYRSNFGERMIGTGEFAKLLHQRWLVMHRQLGFSDFSTDHYSLDCSQFKHYQKQMVLF